jgi:hypothetical protein
MSRKWIGLFACCSLYADTIIPFTLHHATHPKSHDSTLKAFLKQHKNNNIGYIIDARNGIVLKSVSMSPKTTGETQKTFEKHNPKNVQKHNSMPFAPQTKQKIIYKGDKILHPIEINTEMIYLE